MQKSYDVYGPRIYQGTGCFSDTDVVRYGLLNSWEEIVWNQKSDYSFKEVLLPISETILYFTENEMKTADGAARQRLIFLKSCDFHALKRLDDMYLKNGAEDYYYRRMRENTVFAVMGCKESGKNCFCVSMGTNRCEEYDMYIFQDEKEYKNYQNKIDKLKERYADRLNEIEAQKKAREEVQRKAEEEAEAERKKAEEEARKESERVYAETHYENDYFSVDTSSDWIGDWKMTEEDQSTNGILCKKYVFDYHPDKENYGGLAEVYVIDMSDDSIPESVYDKMYPDYASEVGTTSFGAYHIFMLQVGGDFFGESNDHATLTVK